jgi:transcriptional regulator with XRE-family HTH domain
MQKKSPNQTDKHVGSRVRMRRLELRISQANLAKGLGLTFQQVQKYESGTNRMSASRLEQAAHILKVPVTFFFDGVSHVPSGPSTNDRSVDDLTDFMATSEGLALAKAFMQISSVQLRRRIVNLVERVEQNRNGSTLKRKRAPPNRRKT